MEGWLVEHAANQKAELIAMWARKLENNAGDLLQAAEVSQRR